jgi:hypothetical protein
VIRAAKNATSSISLVMVGGVITLIFSLTSRVLSMVACYLLQRTVEQLAASELALAVPRPRFHVSAGAPVRSRPDSVHLFVCAINPHPGAVRT